MMKGILLNIFLMRLWQMKHIARLHIPIRKWSDFTPKAPKIGEKYDASVMFRYFGPFDMFETLSANGHFKKY